MANSSNAAGGGAAMSGTAAPGSLNTVRDLLLSFKDPLVTFTSIINNALNVSPQFAGFVYEACWRVCVALRVVIPNAEMNVGNSNNGFVAMRDFKTDLFDRKIVSGSSDGFSDITWRCKDVLWISTCKLISEKASLEEYDLDKLSSLATKYPNASRCVFVRRKQTFESTFAAARSKEGRHHHKVYDIADLDSFVPQIRRLLATYNWDIDEIATAYMPNVKKTIMKLYFHQILARLSRKRMNNHAAILFELKCRSGKSYILADDILQFNSKCVLVLTPIPSETKKALLQMFDGLVEFSHYSVCDLKRGTVLPSGSRPTVFVASKQYFDKHIDREDLLSLKFDAVYFDEFHFSGLTKKARKIFKAHVRPTTRFVTLTGTGEKPRRDFGISASQTFTWTLHQEALARAGDVRGLEAEYGREIIKESLETTFGVGCDYSAELIRAYASTPVLTHFGVTFSREFLKRFKEFEGSESYSFDVAELLRVKEDGTFAHPEKVAELLDLHFGRSGPGTSTMSRIRSYGTRTGQVGDQYFEGGGGATQFWFLPEGGSGIHVLSECMKRAIEGHRGYGKRYAVAVFNGKVATDSREGLEGAILKKEREAIAEGKEGLIVLLGSMGNMGISIPRADVVVMLNNTHEMDRYIQMIMRCMTEHRNDDPQKQKSRGFVVDYNQKRLLRFCMSIVPSGHTTVDGILRRASEIINIDVDDFVTQDKTSVVEELMTLWRTSTVNRLDEIRSRLEKTTEISLTSADYTSLRRFMREVSATRTVRDVPTFELHDEEDKISDSEVASIPASESQTVPSQEEPVEDEAPDLASEIMRTIPYYVAIMTSRNPESDIITLLQEICADPQRYASFCEACKTWWAGAEMEGFLDCMINIFTNRCDLHTKREINSAIKMMKVEVSRMLDNKKQLLELINSMLTPKLYEKATFGEVFTPLSVVEMMLDSLPAHVWTNPTLRWFDPAVGIGNFMVCVYYRLMEGLKERIPDFATRKAHILKNMLFMSELGAKNIVTCKVVFEDACNLHCGDTLELNVREKWGFDTFDVIVGNPPYNKGGIRSSTGSMLGEKNETIWPNFVHQALGLLSEGGYLCFVNPLSWLKHGHSCHDEILARHVLWLQLWDDSKAKASISADIPLSLYVVENTLNSEKKPTLVVSDMIRQSIHTESNVYLDPSESIPFAFHSLFSKITQRMKANPELCLSVHTKTVKSEGSQVPFDPSITPADMYGVDTYRIQDGIQLKRMTTAHPDTTTPKLILANKSSFRGSILDSGRLGLVGNHKFYITGSNLDRLQKVFNTKIANVIAENTRYGQHFLDKCAFNFIPDVRNIPTSELPDVTDAHLAKYLGLTSDECVALSIE